MRMNEFYDLPWHDAVISRIEIDRTDAGNSDTPRVSVAWPTEPTEYADVLFHDCWRAELALNFGVICEESIRSVEWDENENVLAPLRRHLGLELRGLKRFRIETNSTASTIVVFAMDVSVLSIGPDRAAGQK